jgi:hypothetical protein
MNVGWKMYEQGILMVASNRHNDNDVAKRGSETIAEGFGRKMMIDKQWQNIDTARLVCPLHLLKHLRLSPLEYLAHCLVRYATHLHKNAVQIHRHACRQAHFFSHVSNASLVM